MSIIIGRCVLLLLPHQKTKKFTVVCCFLHIFSIHIIIEIIIIKDFLVNNNLIVIIVIF